MASATRFIAPGRLVAKALYRLQQEASPTERKRIANAFRKIVEKLQLDPHLVGEPLYRLPSLRMQVRTAVFPPLAIMYAVCEDRPLVFIKKGRLLAAP
jgi:hypothetical protein